MKKIYAAILVAITAGNFAMAQTGTLKGKAIDETTGEGISFANVQLHPHALLFRRSTLNNDFFIKQVIH